MFTSQITSRAALAEAERRQAVHETAQCPNCHDAAHPTVLAALGVCTTCRTAALAASIA